MKSKILTLVASILIAFGLWFYVITVEHTQVDTTFHNIPVALDGKSVLDERDLIITSGTDLKVDLRLSGNRTNLNKLKISDISVTVDLTKIYEEGEKELTYKVEIPGGSTIEVVSREPSSIKLTVEKAVTAEVPLQVQLEQGALPTDFELLNTQLSMENVIVRGPERLIGQIKSAKLMISAADIAQNRVATSDMVVLDKKYTLCDEQGQPITEYDLLTVNKDEVRVEMQVAKVKDVPLVYDLVPGGGLTAADVSITLDSTTVRLAGSQADIDKLNVLSIGVIDLTDPKIVSGQPFTRVLNLSENLTNISGITEVTVTVTFHKEVVTKTLEISSKQFQAVNKPQNLEPQYLTQKLKVTLRGTEQALAQLDEKNVIVSVDLSNLHAGERLNFAATVWVEGTNEIGAIGTYYVNVGAIEI